MVYAALIGISYSRWKARQRNYAWLMWFSVILFVVNIWNYLTGNILHLSPTLTVVNNAILSLIGLAFFALLVRVAFFRPKK
jgi:hypothetical protein